MNINDKAVDNISQWLGQIGGLAPGVYGKALQIAAFVLFVYVKLPPTGRAITDMTRPPFQPSASCTGYQYHLTTRIKYCVFSKKNE